MTLRLPIFVLTEKASQIELTVSMADENNKNNNKKLHIAIFPWLAFGHMLPYLEFAKLIAVKGHRVSFISTPRNLHRLLPNVPSHVLPLIDFVELSLPRLDIGIEDLPDGAEATIDVPHEKVKFLKKAFDALQHPISRFLESASPDWLLHDFAPYWVPPIASKLGIPTAFFSIYTAAQVGFFFRPTSPNHQIEYDRTALEHYTVTPKWVPFHSEIAPQLHEILRLAGNLSGDEVTVSDNVRIFGTLTGCDIMAVRSCAEFEPEWLSLLESLHGKPVIPVGQIPSASAPSAAAAEDDGGGDSNWGWIKEWLEAQEKGSVVYVAFGSEVKPTQYEVTGLAQGLELSELPFFWALRTRRGVADSDEVVLPEGFEDRTRGQGVVYTGWAPQMRILSHDSVGGFLSHAGWSSVVEAMQLERALILFPFLADQGLNARYLVEKKMGYLIPRANSDGSFTAESVAESLRLVMVEEGGKVYKDKAKEMSSLFGDRNRQDRYVDNFLDYLQTHKNIHKAAAS